MGGLVLVLGGQKSGKSAYAAGRARAAGGPVVVVAPAVVRDDEFADRVARHRADRPADWRTIEDVDLPRALGQAGPGAEVIVDALDTWLAEHLLAEGLDLGDRGPSRDDLATAERRMRDGVADLVAAARSRTAGTVVVAGQPGLGPHAMGRGARAYVDLHGLMTQALAAASDEVVLMVAGRPLPLAPTPPTPGPSPATRRSPELAHLCRAVPASDPDLVREARRRQAGLARPPGSLGALDGLAARLAGAAGRCPPPLPEHPVVVVAAGDHGVHARGVSDWPQDVTAAMVRTVAAGGATVNAHARAVAADVLLVDVGTVTDGPVPHGVVDRRVRAGTRDLSVEPAMTLAECAAAVEAGIEVTREALTAGADLVVLGDLGIGNTTASACLVAAFTGATPDHVVGPGANRDTARVGRKVEVVAAALRRHGDDADPMHVLASLGGLEHAALVGVTLAAAAARVPVVLDGVVTDAAALAACALAPTTVDHLVAGHASTEPGATASLAHLGLEPLLDLRMRLGEGTGGLLAVPLVRAAVRGLAEVDVLDPTLAAPRSDRTRGPRRTG